MESWRPRQRLHSCSCRVATGKPPCTWVTKSIQKRAELSSQPLELGQIVGIEMPANLVQRARATGKQPLRLCHFALPGCDGGPIQAGPRLAITLPGTGRVPLQEPLPGLVDPAEVKLDPSEVVQLRRNPGQVSDLPEIGRASCRERV